MTQIEHLVRRETAALNLSIVGKWASGGILNNIDSLERALAKLRKEIESE